MSNTKKKALRVGFLVLTSLSIFVFSIYLIGSKDNLFQSKVRVYCIFQDIKGLMKGNNVQFSGINVGTVKDINITSDSTVVLQLDIAKEYAKFIYKNAIAEINQDGLMGGKLLSISSKNRGKRHIQDGDTLTTNASIDIQNMLNMTNNIMVNVSDMVKTIRNITHKIDSGKGDLSVLLNENKLTEQLQNTGQKLNSSLEEIHQITHKINSGKGDIAQLINQDSLTTNIYRLFAQLQNTNKSVDKILGEFQTTAQRINNKEGAINQFLNNPEFVSTVDSTIQNINSSLYQFNQTAKAIENSWFLRVFSKKKKQQQKNDTIIIKRK